MSPGDFLRAYDRFMAQGIYVSPPAQKWLGERAATLPPNYILMQGKLQSRVIPAAGKRIGVVWFAPDGPDGLADAQSDAIRAGRELRGQVDLLVGVSPWGSDAERKFTERVEGLYHIIMGGGPGYGFGSSLKGANKGVLWLRPEPQGSAVNVVEILSWPEPALHIWEYSANFTARVELLGPNVPSDAVIEEIFNE